VNDPGLFVAGGIVVLIVAIAMGFLAWGLRMEARQNRARDRRRRNGADRALQATGSRDGGTE
jgi:hypothetical protein